MIQDGQLVKFVNGGDAARIQKVQIAVGRDATRAPRVQHSARGMPVQVVTGEDPTRAPFIHPFEGLAPAAWFRAGQGITVTGSGVSQWDDQSGNDRHLLQGTDAARPALQGDGTILFNGTSHYLKTNAFTLNQPEWVLWVGKQVSWTAGEYFFDGNSNTTGIIIQAGTTPEIRINAGATVAGNTGLAVGTRGVVSAQFNGASSSLCVNNATPTTGNAGTANMGGLTLGARADGLIFYSNISTSELIVFPFAPSAALQARIIAGLMARHGVA